MLPDVHMRGLNDQPNSNGSAPEFNTPRAAPNNPATLPPIHTGRTNVVHGGPVQSMMGTGHHQEVDNRLFTDKGLGKQ